MFWSIGLDSEVEKTEEKTAEEKALYAAKLLAFNSAFTSKENVVLADENAELSSIFDD